ncbi:LssY C-terminal domain-containing protein [Agromyces sp. LHK192]|uniref:LssY C-terminal domain-containing protein n=1 Tax=Agromyces sp. LHK192 TaxID=2498704 RepID=UPI000FDC1840|nr:LssY C-terminal domain-containing protein [Agromyces sp. LHK192]
MVEPGGGASVDEAEAQAQSPPPVPRRRFSVNAVLDEFFFVFAGLAALWLAYLLFSESFTLGWWGILVMVLFWVLLAYLVLPRLHRVLTTIYVPDYFMGRTRTSDGLFGDPVNLAVTGDEARLLAAMQAAGWTRADEVTLATSWRIITSTVTRRSYDEAPVSPLFLFGRKQDFAFQQEVEGNPAKRHHVRFWRTPGGWLLPGGARVDWLAAGTFDRAVGLSLFTLQVTHKIDADTDVERDHIVRTLRDSDALIEIRVLRDFSTGYHSRNGGGDTIRTDGDLPVVDVRGVTVPPANGSRAAARAPGAADATAEVAR